MEHEHRHHAHNESHEEKSFCKKFEFALGTKRTISLVFLGIGLTLFLLNVSGILAYLPKSYDITSFDISIFASMIMIIYATYMLHEEN